MGSDDAEVQDSSVFPLLRLVKACTSIRKTVPVERIQTCCLVRITQDDVLGVVVHEARAFCQSGASHKALTSWNPVGSLPSAWRSRSISNEIKGR